jgi:hypothetical protein
MGDLWILLAHQLAHRLGWNEGHMRYKEDGWYFRCACGVETFYATNDDMATTIRI